MMKSLLPILKGLRFTKPAGDEDRYGYWQLRIFVGLLFGYVFYYFSRMSLPYAMVVMGRDLGFSKPELGAIVTALTVCYAFSKFTGGILIDRLSSRVLMALGLVVTGLANVCFGMSSAWLLMVILWAINGWFQGCGAPACAKLLVRWYPREQRGIWWSLWNTSHNIGNATIAVFAAFCAGYLGWRYALIIPGTIAILGGLFVFERLRDCPHDVGFSGFEEEEAGKKEKPSLRELLVESIFRKPAILALGVAFFFVYVVRMGVSQWIAIYLNEVEGYSVMAAGAMVGWIEVGGFLGNLAAGSVSAFMFRGARGPVNVLFTLGVLATVFFLWKGPEGAFLWDAFGMFCFGFFIFGPQMMVGLAAAEIAGPRAAATATGFVGLFAYAGGSAAGYPLGQIIEIYGWQGYFAALLISGCISLAVLVPFWSLGKEREPALQGV